MKKRFLIFLRILIISWMFVACSYKIQDQFYEKIIIETKYGKSVVSVNLAITNEGESFISDIANQPEIVLKLIPCHVGLLEYYSESGTYYYMFSAALFRVNPSEGMRAFFVDKDGKLTKVDNLLIDIPLYTRIPVTSPKKPAKREALLKKSYDEHVPVIVKGRIEKISRVYTKNYSIFGKPSIDNEIFMLYLDIWYFEVSELTDSGENNSLRF